MKVTIHTGKFPNEVFATVVEMIEVDTEEYEDLAEMFHISLRLKGEVALPKYEGVHDDVVYLYIEDVGVVEGKAVSEAFEDGEIVISYDSERSLQPEYGYLETEHMEQLLEAIKKAIQSGEPVAI